MNEVDPVGDRCGDPGLAPGDRRFPPDVFHLLALFSIFLVVDRLTSRFSTLPPERLFSSVLLQQAAAENLLLTGIILVGVVGSLALGGRRLFGKWGAVENGAVLRVLGSTVALWLAWRMSTYDFNYVLDQWHTLDRVLVVTVAIAAVVRPVFLLPLVAQVRVINAQFFYPLGTGYGQAIDEMMVLVLVVLGSTYLYYALSGWRKSSAALLIISTIVAAHLFEPGRGKLAMGWLQENDTSHLAFNSFTAGWRGSGDGVYAQRLGQVITSLGWPLRVGTLVLELGALVAVADPRLFRLWLPLVAIFHCATFTLTGFFFFDWMALELGLCLILSMPRYREWVSENSTPVRAMIAMTAVAFGATLYRPPPLAWMDSPVAYGYEVDVTGVSGEEYHLPLSAFAPFAKEMTFAQPTFSNLPRASGGYGATSRLRAEELRSLTEISQLSAFEANIPSMTQYPDSLSERLLTSFFRYMSVGPGTRNRFGRAPLRFWSSVGSPSFRGEEPIVELRVALLASLTVAGVQQFRRTPLLTITQDRDGALRIEREEAAGSGSR